MLLSRGLAGRLTDSVGARWVAAVGFAIVAIATIPFALATTTTSEWYLMAALVARGFGMGAVFIPIMTAAFVGLDRPDVPHASILTRISQQVGGSFGVALLAVILEGALATYAVPTLANTASAFDQAFWWCVGLSALATIVSFALPTRTKPEVAPSMNSGTESANSGTESANSGTEARATAG
jgi:MFS family permease